MTYGVKKNHIVILEKKNSQEIVIKIILFFISIEIGKC